MIFLNGYEICFNVGVMWEGVSPHTQPDVRTRHRKSKRDVGWRKRKSLERLNHGWIAGKIYWCFRESGKCFRLGCSWILDSYSTFQNKRVNEALYRQYSLNKDKVSFSDEENTFHLEVTEAFFPRDQWKKNHFPPVVSPPAGH